MNAAEGGPGGAGPTWGGSSQQGPGGAQPVQGDRTLSHAGTAGFGLGGPGRDAPARPAARRRAPATVTSQAPGNPWTSTGRLVLLGVIGFVVVAVLTAGLASGWAAPGFHESGHFLDFYTGVFALVALSISVMIGLAASDQLVLAPRQRVLAQAVHRGAAFTAVAMLAVHVGCQLAMSRVGVLGVVIPFLPGHRAAAVGFGVLAAYLMIIVCVSGIVRGRFATRRRPWLWRAVHATAYLAWPPAIIHGLLSGRSAAPWVTLSYILCVLLVVLALPTRLVTKARAGRPG